MRILSVNTGRVEQRLIQGRSIATAIGKQPREGAVAYGRLGLEGDEQADPSVHGGIAKAIYAYPAEHLPFWRTVRAQAQVAAWDAEVPPGLLGENLTLEGVTEDRLWVGDRLCFADGGILAVSEPRFPCFKLNAALGFNKAAKLMAESGYCGSYLAVITPGRLKAGDSFTLEPGAREVNLRELFRSRTVGKAF